MEYLAHRCAAVATAAFAVGGVVATLTSTAPSLPDVQVRDFDLAAANVDPHPVVDIVENHVRPDMVGGGAAAGHEISLGDLLFGPGEGSLGDGSTFDVGELDQTVLNELSGGNFDPQILSGSGGVSFDADLGAVATPTVGLFGGGSEQAAVAAATNAVTGMALILDGIPAAQQGLNAAIVAMQAEFNSALVAAQQAAADRLFGDSPELNEVVNWIFYLNNTVLADQQAILNSALGITFDAHGSLLGSFAPEIADLEWSTLLGFSPEEFDQIIDAIQADNLWLLLGTIDWEGLFAGLF